ncbi:hypothetical protein N2152v2_005021 [Parachlorella kessleri]
MIAIEVKRTGDRDMGNTLVLCSLYVAGTCVEYKNMGGNPLCSSQGPRQFCTHYDLVKGCLQQETDDPTCLDTYVFQVTDSAGLISPITVGLPADVSFVLMLKSQVELATGRTVLALKYGGQSLDPVSSDNLASLGLGWPAPNAASPPVIPLTVDLGASQSSDPLMTGFDGSHSPPCGSASMFHFDEVGEYNMLWEASGLKVDAIFEGTGTAEGAGAGAPAEKSFVRVVRVTTPNGKSVLY